MPKYFLISTYWCVFFHSIIHRNNSTHYLLPNRRKIKKEFHNKKKEEIN